MGAMRALRAPGGGWSRMATCGRDRSSFNTEPGLRFGRSDKARRGALLDAPLRVFIKRCKTIFLG